MECVAKHCKWAAAAIGILLFMGVVSVPSAGAAAPPNGFSATDIPPLRSDVFGLAGGAGLFMNTDQLPAALQDAKVLGVRTIRSTLAWKNFEPNDPSQVSVADRYNWRGIDTFLSILNSPPFAGRFQIIATIEEPPDWAMNSAPIGHISCPEQPPFDLQTYANASAALANHVAGRGVHIFELENSPNIAPDGDIGAGFWAHANPCGYTQLLKKTYTAIHTAQPSDIVLTGGSGGTQDVEDGSSGLYFRMAADEFIQQLYNYGAQGSFDGIAYHPYSFPDDPCDPAAPTCVFDPNPLLKDPYGLHNSWDRMLNTRNIMVAEGDGQKKIWVTEYGAPTNNGGNDASELHLLDAGFYRAAQTSWIGPLCWFNYQDGNDSDSGNDMGLLRENGARKPAFAEYKRLTTLSVGAPPSSGGYWILGSDGGVFSFGAAQFYGSTGGMRLNQPVVGMAATTDSQGYYLVASDGGIFSYGDAKFYGSTGAMHLNQPVVGMAVTPTGHGYWLVAADGGIFSFGDAKFYGSTGAIHLNKPVRGMLTTNTGNGYWLYANDGGIFSFGDAAFHGSLPQYTNADAVGMGLDTSGQGYWTLAVNGAIYSFGDAQYYGGANAPSVGFAASPSGAGYYILGPDGSINPHGDAQNYGSLAGVHLNGAPVTIVPADL